MAFADVVTGALRVNVGHVRMNHVLKQIEILHSV